jgi:hypothetical protein
MGRDRGDRFTFRKSSGSILRDAPRINFFFPSRGVAVNEELISPKEEVGNSTYDEPVRNTLSINVQLG